MREYPIWRAVVWWCWSALALTFLLAIIGLGIGSFYGQIRLFAPYGPSIAADQSVFVVEVEYPERLGFRFVGSDTEQQHRYLGNRLIVAWNPTPEADSELRKLRVRQFTPWCGVASFVRKSWGSAPASVPKSKACWVSSPGWLVLVIATWATFKSLQTAVRRSRRKGICRSCGYSLQGLPPGAVCPECGAGRAEV